MNSPFCSVYKSPGQTFLRREAKIFFNFAQTVFIDQIYRHLDFLHTRFAFESFDSLPQKVDGGRHHHDNKHENNMAVKKSEIFGEMY